MFPIAIVVAVVLYYHYVLLILIDETVFYMNSPHYCVLNPMMLYLWSQNLGRVQVIFQKETISNLPTEYAFKFVPLHQTTKRKCFIEWNEVNNAGKLHLNVYIIFKIFIFINIKWFFTRHTENYFLYSLSCLPFLPLRSLYFRIK